MACIVKKTLSFEDYKNCLSNPDAIYKSQWMFRLTKHEVHTIEVNKVALNRDDDKVAVINLFLGVPYLASYHLDRTK